MKKFWFLVVLVFGCSLSPLSQAEIIKKSKRTLEDDGYLHLRKWLTDDKRVSIDTLAKICLPQINTGDSVRNAIFTYLSRISNKTVIELMGAKIVSGGSGEKLIAAAYIYEYYKFEKRDECDTTFAALLFLFHSIADNLSKNPNSRLYNSIEQKAEIATTFPKTENLYREFILNQKFPTNVRTWFIESLMEHGDREIVITFLLDIDSELDKNDPDYGVVQETLYTLMSRGTKGGWMAVD